MWANGEHVYHRLQLLGLMVPYLTASDVVLIIGTGYETHAAHRTASAEGCVRPDSTQHQRNFGSVYVLYWMLAAY